MGASEHGMQQGGSVDEPGPMMAPAGTAAGADADSSAMPGESRPARPRKAASSSVLVRLGLVGLGALGAAVVVSVLFSGGEVPTQTVVPSPPGLGGAQRQDVPLTPEMQRLTDERNALVVDRAEQEGRSAVAAPIFVPPTLPGTTMAPQENLALPAVQEPAPPEPRVVVQPLPQFIPPPPPPPMPAQQPQQQVSPDLLNWYEQFRRWQGEAAQTVVNGSVDEFLRQRRAGVASVAAGGELSPQARGGAASQLAASNSPAAPASSPNLPASQPSTALSDLGVSPGDILLGRVMTEVVSTERGPVVVELFDGPLRGSRLLGSFQTGESGLLVSFNRLVFVPQRADQRSEVLGIEAVAIDPNTQRPSVATSVDRRILQRLGITLASSFMSGLGQAIGRAGTVITTGPFGTIEQRVGQLNTRQQLLVAAGQAAQEGGRAAQDVFGPTGPVITLASGAVIGVLIIDVPSSGTAR